MTTPLSANDQAVKTLADDLWKEMLAASPLWAISRVRSRALRYFATTSAPASSSATSSIRE